MKVSNDNKPPTSVIVASTAGALLTTGAYVYHLAKHKQGKNIIHKISNVELGIKEGILLCGASVAGGLLGGLATDSKENRVPKIQEAMQQVVGNGLIPFSCLALVNLITKKFNKVARTIVAVGTLFASTFLGHAVVDKILNTNTKYKVGFIDFAPDIDDWVLAASTVLNSKSLYKFTATVCPFTYAILGIKTGLKQKEDKKLDKQV